MKQIKQYNCYFSFIKEIGNGCIIVFADSVQQAKENFCNSCVGKVVEFVDIVETEKVHRFNF